jgi:hypothetical protein
MAVAFGLGMGRASSEEVAYEFFAAYMLEVSLSAENLFAMYMIFKYFKVPVQYQENVLWYDTCRTPSSSISIPLHSASSGLTSSSRRANALSQPWGQRRALARGCAGVRCGFARCDDVISCRNAQLTQPQAERQPSTEPH